MTLQIKPPVGISGYPSVLSRFGVILMLPAVSSPHKLENMESEFKIFMNTNDNLSTFKAAFISFRRSLRQQCRNFDSRRALKR